MANSPCVCKLSPLVCNPGKNSDSWGGERELLRASLQIFYSFALLSFLLELLWTEKAPIKHSRRKELLSAQHPTFSSGREQMFVGEENRRGREWRFPRSNLPASNHLQLRDFVSQRCCLTSEEPLVFDTDDHQGMRTRRAVIHKSNKFVKIPNQLETRWWSWMWEGPEGLESARRLVGGC